jgi:hypothetical protein
MLYVIATAGDLGPILLCLLAEVLRHQGLKYGAEPMNGGAGSLGIRHRPLGI